MQSSIVRRHNITGRQTQHAFHKNMAKKTHAKPNLYKKTNAQFWKYFLAIKTHSSYKETQKLVKNHNAIPWISGIKVSHSMGLELFGLTVQVSKIMLSVNVIIRKHNQLFIANCRYFYSTLNDSFLRNETVLCYIPL